MQENNGTNPFNIAGITFKINKYGMFILCLTILFSQCGECLKWRVCYAARVLKPEQRRQLERELELLAFSCGTCFQDVSTDGDEESVFNVVYVNDKLTCDLPIEAPYYVTFDDPLCFFCGSEHDLITGDGNYPLCNECRDAGKKPHKKNTWAFNPRPQ